MKTIVIEGGSYLHFQHQDNQGKITVNTFARVEKINRIKKTANVRFPSNSFSDNNSTIIPVQRPICGMAEMPSITHHVDGDDIYQPVKTRDEIPTEILTRLS